MKSLIRNTAVALLLIATSTTSFAKQYTYIVCDTTREDVIYRILPKNKATDANVAYVKRKTPFAFECHTEKSRKKKLTGYLVTSYNNDDYEYRTTPTDHARIPFGYWGMGDKVNNKIKRIDKRGLRLYVK